MSKTLNSTNLYAYTTLISVIICTPLALLMEGGALTKGIETAITKVGANQFYLDLLMVGLLYHLYNQVGDVPIPPQLVTCYCGFSCHCSLLGKLWPVQADD